MQEAESPRLLPGGFQSTHPSFITVPFTTTFFYIHETHRKVYTNKPRALLMQQALYNEPKRARLLWEDGTSVQTLGGFPLQKHQLTLSRQPLDPRLPQPSLPRFQQAVPTDTPDQQRWPATLADSHNVSSALFVDKGIDYRSCKGFRKQ